MESPSEPGEVSPARALRHAVPLQPPVSNRRLEAGAEILKRRAQAVERVAAAGVLLDGVPVHAALFTRRQNRAPGKVALADSCDHRAVFGDDFFIFEMNDRDAALAAAHHRRRVNACVPDPVEIGL